MSDVTHSPRVPAAAWLALLLGLASLPLFPVALVALVVGLRTVRRINESDGALRGARLAQAGLVAAVLGLVVPALGVVAMIAIKLQVLSRQVECTDRMRQIGLALNKYADTNGTFPAATRTPADLAADRRLSWMADALPLLAEGRAVAKKYQEVAAAIDRQKGWDDPANAATLAAQIRAFHCPAHDGPPTNRTDYVGLVGVGPNAIDRKRSDPLAGVFGNDQGVRRAEVTAGISHTMMALETADENGPWLAGGFPTARGFDPDIERYAGRDRPFGGLHPGIVNVLWVDGSVRPVADSTPGEMFRLQATIRRDVP